ncbi:PRA1 family protein A1-like [Hordeum vulgare]|nr:PRA1 family protein A1-like [Hordeum vulgare]
MHSHSTEITRRTAEEQPWESLNNYCGSSPTVLMFCSYGTNYFILIILIGMSFLQKPVAILTAFASGLSVAFFSDSFAVTSTYKVITIVRKISPDLAAKMRPYMK